MTVEFDELMSIMEEAINTMDKNISQVADWLADICIEQANRKKEGFNFEVWKKSDNIYATEYKDYPFQLKMMFLNICHDELDHTNWHHKVFDENVLALINLFYDAIIKKRQVSGVKHLSKRFPELPNMLEKLGYKPLDKQKNWWDKT
jgi:hypothetical protein